MDILTLIGVVLGLFAIIGGAILKGSSAGALVGSAAFVIVVLGTLAASLMQTPLHTFLRAWKIVVWVFKPPASNGKAMIDKIVEWSNIARKQGLLGLESVVEGEKDNFLKKGLQSLVDGGNLTPSAPRWKSNWTQWSISTPRPPRYSRPWASTRPLWVSLAR